MPKGVNASLRRYFSRLGVEAPPEPIAHIASAFSAREFHKFSFTAVLSDLLEATAELGQRHGLSRGQTRLLPIGALGRLVARDDDGALHDTVAKAALDAGPYGAMQWPDLISSRFSFDVIEYIDARPTYISGRVVDSTVWRLAGMPDRPKRGRRTTHRDRLGRSRVRLDLHPANSWTHHLLRWVDVTHGHQVS